MGTHWEPRKMKNNPSLSFPAPQKNLKRKKARDLE
jgi:hypothetical protein